MWLNIAIGSGWHAVWIQKRKFNIPENIGRHNTKPKIRRVLLQLYWRHPHFLEKLWGTPGAPWKISKCNNGGRILPKIHKIWICRRQSYIFEILVSSSYHKIKQFSCLLFLLPKIWIKFLLSCVKIIETPSFDFTLTGKMLCRIKICNTTRSYHEMF